MGILTKQETAGVVRTVAAAGFGVLASKGYIDGETAQALGSALAVILVGAWSVKAKRKRVRPG